MRVAACTLALTALLAACSGPGAAPSPRVTAAPSGPSALLGVPGPLPAQMHPLVFDGTPLLVQDPTAWNSMPDAAHGPGARAPGPRPS